MEKMTAEGFADAHNVSRETLSRLTRYLDLLKKWNPAINLVSPKSLQDPWRRHVLDSAQLFPLIVTNRNALAPEKEPGSPDIPKLLDMGSGAGFPGMVLAILGTAEVHLVESDTRKCVFLREVARETGTEVHIHNSRLEDMASFDVGIVTARALAPLEKLLELASPYFEKATAPGLGLFLKGQSLDQELTDSTKLWDFAYQRYPSQTDPAGSILQVELRPPPLRREPRR